MTEIVFGGVVSSGIGHHATLYVPGRAELRNAPADWPERLHPGSLNVSVDQYPPEFMNRGLRNSVSELDLGRFVPEFEILRDQFQNNKIEPRPDLPRGGDAQVWRTRLRHDGVGAVIKCWTLRRLGSQVGEQLECVAGRRLRDFGLDEGLRVEVALLGEWRDA
jgi:hypothetical protein